MFGVVKSAEFKFDIQNRWGNKNEFLSNMLHKHILMNSRLFSHIYI